MSKTKKVILIVIAAVFLLLAAGFIFFFTSLNTLHFEYNDVRGFSVFSPDEADSAQENESFDIGYPEFTASAIRRMTRYNLDDALSVYSVINDNTVNYLTELAERYSNRVNLDYTVVIENDTLTISFFGTAYPSGNDAGVDINKVFEYSIKNASAQNPPVLGTDTTEPPDIEYPDFVYESSPSYTYTYTTDPDLAGFVPLTAEANDNNSLEESKQIASADTLSESSDISLSETSEAFLSMLEDTMTPVPPAFYPGEICSEIDLSECPIYPDFVYESSPSYTYTYTTDPDLAGFVPLAAESNDNNSLEESWQIKNDDTFYPPEWRTRVYWTVSDEDTIYNIAEPPEYPEYDELYGEQ